MDKQKPSLDAYLQQDFRIPDQLFEDSDVGIEDMCSMVEIETSEEEGCKAQNVVSDGGNVTTMSETPQSVTVGEQDVAVQQALPSNTIAEPTNGGANCATVKSVTQSEQSLPSPNRNLPAQAKIQEVNPLPSQASQIIVTPVPVSTSGPVSRPTNHAPVKMVSVPVNSDVITQGNSQVVLIPVGGMDSSKLEGALKVPQGQKLVIIKPQEILKTIEEKRLQNASGVVLPKVARNLAQQGIILQGVNQAGFQQIPVSQVAKLGVVGTGPVQAMKGLLKLSPKSVAQTIQGTTLTVQSANGGGPLIPGVLRPLVTGTVQGVASSETGGLRQQLSGNTRSVGIANVRPQAVCVNKASFVRPVGQGSGPSASSTVKLQALANQVSKQAANANNGETAVGEKQQPKTATQGGIVGRIAPVQLSALPTSRVSPPPSQTSSTTSQASTTTSQTSTTTTQTSLTASQTGSTSSQLPSSSSSPTKAHSEAKPNLYQALKQKLEDESSSSGRTDAEHGKPPEVPLQGSKDQTVSRSPQSEADRSGDAVSKNTTPQKVVVTYVSPDTRKLEAGNRVTPLIQVPAKRDEVKRSSVGQSGRASTATNGSKPATDGSASKPASGQQPADGKQPANGMQPKIVPRISSPIRQVKTEDGEKQVETPSTSAPTKTPPSSGLIPSSESGESVRKRGRPRKNLSADTENVVKNKQNIKKPNKVLKETWGAKTSPTIHGPTLKQELSRQGSAPKRRANRTKPSEQIKTVKNKRVSSTNPWTCALCGKVPFIYPLGCLYGPYDEESDLVDKEEGWGEGVISNKGDEPQQKKRRGSSNSDEGGGLQKGTRELWFHGECMVWSPGVYALGESLAGYKQVVCDAQSRKCDCCGNNGATLVCLQRTCKKQYHFFCAKKKGCVFDESNYTIQCGKHMK